MNFNDKEEKVQEWFESTDPEIDYNELNKANIISRYTKTPTTNIDTTDTNLTQVFNNLENLYKIPEIERIYIPSPKKKEGESKIETNEKELEITESRELNPEERINMIKNELVLIEKDLSFYNENKGKFKGNYTISEALSELNICKSSLKAVENSNNYSIIKEFIKKGISLKNRDLGLLNKDVYGKINEHLKNKIEIINKLKDHKMFNISEAKFELFLTPDSKKIKLFSKMAEIKKSLEDIQNKIGHWDMRTKKQSISEVVNNVKNNLRLLDKEFQKELASKLENLSHKLKDIINDENINFYNTSLDKKKIGELFSMFQSAKDVEELIFRSISKLESYKNAHEESAYIYVKLQEVVDNQENIKQQIYENHKIIQELDQNMKENIEMIRMNLQILKKRLKALKK